MKFFVANFANFAIFSGIGEFDIPENTIIPAGAKKFKMVSHSINGAGPVLGTFFFMYSV